jgi:polyvinyl alcohol dehydrogenase (cytochrome)
MRLQGFASKTKIGRTSGKSMGFRMDNIGIMFGVVALTLFMSAEATAQGWPNFGGQDNANTASAGGVSLNAQNVNTLKPRWVFTTGGDVSARASISGGVAYFPDWAGNLYAVNANNGSLI